MNYQPKTPTLFWQTKDEVYPVDQMKSAAMWLANVTNSGQAGSLHLELAALSIQIDDWADAVEGARNPTKKLGWLGQTLRAIWQALRDL